MATRRSYGTGSLIVREDGNGHAAWHGKWRTGGRQVMRRIGVKRAEGPGTASPARRPRPSSAG
jgi:hypothetical protein